MSKLYVVGIGPGNYENMTVRADEALKSADAIIGYHVYVELVKARYPEKEYLTTPMTREAERCRMALDEAKKGRNTALVCSGDSGIYGMAGLCFELRGEDAEPEIEVVPGLTAACSGAAHARFRRYIAFRQAHGMGDHRKAFGERGGGGSFDRPLQSCEPRPPRSSEKGLRNTFEIPSRRPYLRHCPQYRARGGGAVFIGNSSAKMINGSMVTPRGYRNV